MSSLCVLGFGVSLDGFGAGPDQRADAPLGQDGETVFRWFFPTRTFHRMNGKEGGVSGVDDDFAARGFANVGAWIIGRNMFGPVRGPWPDAEWRGWWGEEPPFHTPVYVLTHHARPDFEMLGGTTFHFVTGGIHEALARARTAATAKDVRLGGGVATVRAYLKAGLIDRLHLAVVPALLGRGENVFAGLDWRALGYECAESTAGEQATHIVLRKQSTPAP